jgi:D-threo-aldose 1-dehydrogenase
MQRVHLQPGPITTTRLGFGCAGLMRSPSQRERLAVLHAAYEAGIRHFDVARMYGLGAVEGELGRFARGRRGELVIATKFGIEPSVSIGPLARLQRPARALLHRYPKLRSLVTRRAEGFSAGREYSPEKARASLEKSLRELGTDHVDLLLLHEPSPRDSVRTEELFGFLEECRSAGTVRAWGVSGEPVDSLGVAAGFGDRVLLQLSDSVLAPQRSAELAGRPIVTFRVLAEPLRVLGDALRDPGTRGAWTARLGLDPTGPGTLPRLLLQEAVHANPSGTVLVGSNDPSHVAELAASLEQPVSGPVIEALRKLVRDPPFRVAVT